MNRVFFSLGPVTIYWYSVLILIGIILASFIILKEAKKNNLEDYMENVIFYVIVTGIIGARLYYVIFYEEKYDLISILKIWEGGLAIYGGIIVGLITTIVMAKKNRQSILKTTDILAPGLIIAQAIGRWGNFFNGEAYGRMVSLELLHKLHIPGFIIRGMYIGGHYYHPTFLYESLWCLLGFVILLIIRRVIKDMPGIVTYSYFIWYGIGRFFIESIRLDSLYIGNIRVSQLVSAILIFIGITGIIIKLFKRKKEVCE